MKHFIYIILLSILNSCGLERPKICENKQGFSRVVLKTSSNDCGKESVVIIKKVEIDFIFDELCKSEKKFILDTQGDLWYVNIYIDGLGGKILSLTKTVAGTYYFRDKHGTYSNDKLSKKIVELTRVECE